MDGQRAAAVVAQFTQAGTSLLLSMAAVRVLPSDEFGQYILVVSAIILATGATSGLIGDSLTVLDRADPSMRRALQSGAAACTALAALAVFALSGSAGWLEWRSAAAAGLAAGAFVLEDLVRRTLMANRRFPAVVAVDVAYAVVTVVALIAFARTGGLGLTTFFLAIAGGQVVALVLAVLLVPAPDRYLVPVRGPHAVAALVGFGGWRALHLTVGPLRLWVIRLAVSASAGFAAVGAVEANRLLVAPMFLVIQGLSSALLVSQVALVRSDRARATPQADRDAAALSAATVVVVAVILVARSQIAAVVLGSTELVDARLVLGWGVVALAMALNVPYANVTAAAGAARSALMMRLLDLAAATAGLAVLAAALADEAWFVWAPGVVGVLSCLLAPAQRSVARRALRASPV